MPATSQLDWLISMTAMIVLSWSRATRDLLKACPGAGRGRSAAASLALHRLDAATKLPFLAARPIASLGPPGSRCPRDGFPVPRRSPWMQGHVLGPLGAKRRRAWTADRRWWIAPRLFAGKL